MGCGSSKMQPTSKGKKLLMIGLEQSGKTTLLYQVTKNKKVSAIPTVGHNSEHFSFKGASYQLYDFSGKDTNFTGVKDYIDSASAIIYVVDGADRLSLTASKSHFLKTIFQEKLLGLPVLILLNKCDQPNCMEVDEVKKEFDLNAITNIFWHVQRVSALTKEGITEAFTWLQQ